MSDFWIYVEVGLRHLLNVKAYDHVLFLMALTASNSFQEWKRLLFLITGFAIGHTMALILSLFDLVHINEILVEILILLTILFAAIFNFVALKKSYKKRTITTVTVITLFFGVIHGLGFATYFKTILAGTVSDKIVPLFAFSIGVEIAQLLVVLTILVTSYLAQSAFKISKRDFTIVLSAFIMGVVAPMLIENEFWNTPIWN